MRFIGTFQLLQQPRLTGCSKGFQGENFCHDFTVSEVSYDEKLFDNSATSAQVTLIAGQYAKVNLHGPASLIKDKTIIYPCDKYRCRVGCPCRLCHKNSLNCKLAGSKKTCGDCSECREDYKDHLLFHRALHTLCKFCSNVEEVLPHLTFVVRQIKGYFPHFCEVLTSSSLLFHFCRTILPLKDQSSKFPCDKCGRNFLKKGDLKRHEVSLHFDLSHNCSQCDFKSSRRDNLASHMETAHYSTESSKYQCDVCKKSFSKKANFKRHSKGLRKCETCSQVFCTMQQVQQHKKMTHPAYICEYCSKSFEDNNHLKRHLNGVYMTDGSWKNKCEVCGSKFCTLLELLKHKKSHKKVHFECTYCRKQFTTKWRLTIHQNIREEESCADCGKIVCNKVDLKVHNKTFHSMRRCSLCNTEFCRENYKLHMYSEHQLLV